ncbi:MAG: agmatinase [Myxococcales bacterium]|nr:agmatinase [Myxococcales bacterium]
MDAQKLTRLRELAERDSLEAFEPGVKAVVRGHLERLASAPTFPALLDAPRRNDPGDLDNLECALIGVPFDLGVTNRPGARFGPSALRAIRFVGPWNHASRIVPFALCQIADVGDVPIPSMHDLEAGIAEIERYFERVARAGVTPISAGGDHSITYPILKALGRGEPLGLVHVDAHCDTEGASGGSRFHHGGPFRNAALDGALDPERSIQIGIRGMAELMTRFSQDSGMTVIHAEDFRRLGVAAVIDAARRVVGDGPTYISIDVDGIDPAYTPGTGTPEVGGLTPLDVQMLVRGLHGLHLVGGDVVEVAPAYDPTSNTAQVGAALLFEILCVVSDSVAQRRSTPAARAD